MGNRLLLADDSITIQKVVAIIFANEEFELTVVDNGTAALEKAREIQPDVMLVDALMPGKTGYEVCTEIRRDPRLSSVPILLLIGAFEPLDEEKARDCGADATISKPFESQQLIDKVKELLVLGKNRKAAPAPAAAAPQPVQTAAEDVWGDLSSLDTMPPLAPPAAPARPAPAAAEPAPPVSFAAPAAPAPHPAQAAPAYAAPQAPAASPAPFEEEILEASVEDDLWGAFDMEEAPAAQSRFGVLEPGSEFEAEEFFSFEEEGEEIEETGAPLELLEEPEVQPSAEELFSFEEEESPLAAEPEPATAPSRLPEYEPFSFEPEAFEPAVAAPVQAAAPAAAEPARPAPQASFPQEPQQAPPFHQEAAAVEPQGASAAVGLTEADLIAALSNISREVIERIVWEVVPDLAEVLIKEEIKKLRAGVKG